LATSPQTSDTLRPWQFFTLGALACATAAVFAIRGTSAENLIFACLGIFGAALVAMGVLHALRPLVTGEVRQPEMIGSYTRASIEREKNLVLRSIKELEFDHAMGKIGEADYEEMVARLRTRAVRLLQQLDNTGSGYRELIERELAKRLVKAGTPAIESVAMESAAMESVAQGFSPANLNPAVSAPADPVPAGPAAAVAAIGTDCQSCGTANDADARFCKACGHRLLALLLAVLAFAAPALAQFQMPDPKEMSGIPRPVTDLPAGHVSVRLIRGQLSNNIQGHPVELHAGGKITTLKTDETGRAEFSGVAPGTPSKAVAVVDGERLESQEFAWPGEGGIRLLLVATDKAAGGTPTPGLQPAKGNIVFGDQTRVIIEPTDDALQIYYLLDVQNSARSPVTPASAVIIDAPSGATGTAVLGGTPQAVARGDRVTLVGPFPPGRTELQVAYRMPFFSGDVSVDQKMPLAVPGIAVLMKKVGGASLTSPQLPSVQEREFDGERYVLAQGPVIPAGGVLTLNFSGLPHHSTMPRTIALGLAALMLAGGVWMASTRPNKPANANRMKQLNGKREKIFSDLVRLEQQKRAGTIDAARYAERRPALIAQLERVYRDLDAEGGQGAAA
jgi:hypothetical protein